MTSYPIKQKILVAEQLLGSDIPAALLPIVAQANYFVLSTVAKESHTYGRLACSRHTSIVEVIEAEKKTAPSAFDNIVGSCYLALTGTRVANFVITSKGITIVERT